MLLVPASDIFQMTGLKKGVADVANLMQAIEQALPKHALSEVFAYFSGLNPLPRNALLGKVGSLATFKRPKLLKLDEGEKVTRLARLIADARFAWHGDDEVVRAFFLTLHPLLERRRPLGLAFSELGAMKVERILPNIPHALPVCAQTQARADLLSHRRAPLCALFRRARRSGRRTLETAWQTRDLCQHQL